MLSIFICDDDVAQSEKIQRIIMRFIMTEVTEMELVVVAKEAGKLINFLEENPKTIGIYFLTIELKRGINGLQLARKIREFDTQGYIIFVTSHSELAFLTFNYQVEALDFIIKDIPGAIETRVQACLELVQSRALKNRQSQQLRIKNGQIVKHIKAEDVFFIETSTVPHKLIAHLKSEQLEFYGSISGILLELNRLDANFIQVHQSYLINPTKIDYIDKQERIIYFTNSENCFASYQGLKRLKRKA